MDAAETLTRLSVQDGVEIWKLAARGVERFAVRVSDRRARLVGTLASAEAMVAAHLRQARLARAH